MPIEELIKIVSQNANVLIKVMTIHRLLLGLPTQHAGEQKTSETKAKATGFMGKGLSEDEYDEIIREIKARREGLADNGKPGRTSSVYQG